MWMYGDVLTLDNFKLYVDEISNPIWSTETKIYSVIVIYFYLRKN